MSGPPSPQADPYAVLGVLPSAPFSEVRAAHRRLVRELHPDVNPGARDRFDEVQSAFEMIRASQSGKTAAESKGAARRRVEQADAVAGSPGETEPQSHFEADRHVEGPWQDPGPASGDISSRIEPSQQAQDMGRPAWQPSQSPMPEEPWLSAQPGAARTVADAAARQGRAQPPPHVSYADAAVSVAEAPPRAFLAKPVLEVTATLGRDKLLIQPRAQMLYVLLDLRLSDEIGSSSQPLNLSLVLDHSSSMQRDDKLQRLKEAVARIIDMMSARDYLSIVTFGDRATVLLPCGPLGTKRAAKEALDAIRCRGGTEISTGLRAGLQELQTHAATLISQMIVLTDGQTYGDEEICVELAALAGERQVQITALGLGDDWNSVLLDELATRTGGHSDYVQGAEKLRGVFEDQLRTLQLTALRNLRVSVTPDVSSRVLRATWVAPGIKSLPVPTDPPPIAQPVRLDLGRVSTDREYRLLLEFVVASRKAGTIDVANLEFAYDVPALGLENQTSSCRISAAFVEQWDNEPPVHLRVHDALRKITAHRLQEQALQAIQEGQTQKGTASLRTAAKHLEAAGSPELAKLALAEADRVERQGQAQAGNMKRIIYGTRSLG
jgi:Ca-activated chloride channel family protein